MNARIAVLMPAYNESTPASTLASLRDAAVSGKIEVTVFLVDDASDVPIAAESLPATNPYFSVVLARHAFNLGQGATLETARQLALREPKFSAYVTMDSDGQHRASDALALAKAVAEGADVAFGNRFLGQSNVPFARGVLLRAARIFEWAITGLNLADAHNGLRAFNHAALAHVRIRQSRMAHATEIKQCVSRQRTLAVVEVPVSVQYTRESLEKGQPSLGALDILRDLALHYLFGEPET
jgi:polyprenyl-phospho-N-acetylgalactosaminyl synthase